MTKELIRKFDNISSREKHYHIYGFLIRKNKVKGRCSQEVEVGTLNLSIALSKLSISDTKGL